MKAKTVAASTALMTFVTAGASALAGIDAGLAPAIVGATAGAAAPVAAHFVTDSREMRTRDIVVALIPTIASTVVAGLTAGWSVAIAGLIVGPLASLADRVLQKEEVRSGAFSSN